MHLHAAAQAIVVQSLYYRLRESAFESVQKSVQSSVQASAQAVYHNRIESINNRPFYCAGRCVSGSVPFGVCCSECSELRRRAVVANAHRL